MSAVQPNSSQAQASGLARALLQANLLSSAQFETINKKVQADKSRFIDALISTQAISARDLAAYCSDAFGYPLIDLSVINESLMPEKVIDLKLMLGQQLVAIAKKANKLTIAISDPTNNSALDQVKFQTGMALDVLVVQHDALVKLLDKLSKSSEQSLTELAGDDMDLEFKEDDLNSGAVDNQAAAAAEIDDAPVVKFLQKMLIDAINMGASDLHFEPYEKFYRIRFRIDGELREIAQPPLAIKEKLASRIKVISKLDISEKRVPQDGRMKIQLTQSKSVDFRVSTLPTLFGEKIVMRILDGSQAQMGIDALGYDADQKEILLNAINRPYGMVLVTGPTGSGKTVSLYTCLNILNKPGINIATAEDPAEINLPGVNQVNVNDKAGLNFATALKAFLRQDPDIIMVGEIRDLETADIAIKAAQTGHMVFSTLHTNDAPSTLTRMMNMGVAPFNIASSVILITAQRLARRLCTCKKEVEINDEVLLQAGFKDEELDGSWKPYGPVGCDRCSGSGYKGRVGIYQIMPISEEIETIILANGNALEIEQQAQREGIRNLRQSGLQKVKQGLTSLEEVLGCTNE